ncbi:MAG: F0F1 ATP synthase subunit B [Acidimicrobiales bacterium]|nr:F0F1 ATP synthase subunit B [Acidimicrobiales bacterium]
MLVGTGDFLLPNATFFAELVGFLFVLGFLAKWVLPPLKKIMAERQEEIRSSIENAANAKSDANELFEQAKAELDRAKAEARDIVTRANAVATQLKEEGRERGQGEYDRLVAAAQSDIEQEKVRVREEVGREFGQMVVVAAERVIGAELNAERHTQLIQETINQAGTEAEGK